MLCSKTLQSLTHFNCYVSLSEAYAAQRREAAEMEKDFPDQVGCRELNVASGLPRAANGPSLLATPASCTAMKDE